MFSPSSTTTDLSPQPPQTALGRQNSSSETSPSADHHEASSLVHQSASAKADNASQNDDVGAEAHAPVMQAIGSHHHGYYNLFFRVSHDENFSTVCDNHSQRELGDHHSHRKHCDPHNHQNHRDLFLEGIRFLLLLLFESYGFEFCDGHAFESPNFFKSRKTEEHAAVNVALMSFPFDGFQEIPVWEGLQEQEVICSTTRIRVYPCVPDISFPNGITVLQISKIGG
ncbi:hypothetical protein LWI29_021992 [Acer saccharum]|uniref:Uncharacterized protein n=1 Tax=Acer saccharum TaxID=4024 RepID=A0AA39W1P8_ACESA|nr:hypothetical protein LWI29_021992 [Acer saccharum]